jgi:hypothetical protein
MLVPLPILLAISVALFLVRQHPILSGQAA